MAFIRKRRSWDSQPQEVAYPNGDLGVDTLLHPIGGRLANLAGGAWEHPSATIPAQIVNRHGQAVTWAAGPTSGTAVYRARPPSGPRSIALLYTPAASNSGIWSIAGTETSGSPFILLTKSGADLRLWFGGAYRITMSGVLTAGVPAFIVLTFDTTAQSSSATASLTINGVTSTASATHSTATDTYEFLSGFSVFPTGEFNCVWEVPYVLRNPQEYASPAKFWEAFAPRTIPIPVSAGGGGPTFIPSWARRQTRTIGAGVI